MVFNDNQRLLKLHLKLITIVFNSYNHISGRSLNPYDSSKTPGGSSGGEGALLGAGASVFGIGSDIAGSIRVPAMFNGIFGHKPTAGKCLMDNN